MEDRPKILPFIPLSEGGEVAEVELEMTKAIEDILSRHRGMGILFVVNTVKRESGAGMVGEFQPHQLLHTIDRLMKLAIETVGEDEAKKFMACTIMSAAMGGVLDDEEK